MNRQGSLLVLSFVGAIAYVLAYNFNWPVFGYYPLIGEFHLHAQPKSSGPAMLYYGWITTAAIAAVVLAVIVPSRIGAKLPASLGWIVPLVLILFTFVYDRHWFL